MIGGQNAVMRYVCVCLCVRACVYVCGTPECCSRQRMPVRSEMKRFVVGTSHSTDTASKLFHGLFGEETMAECSSSPLVPLFPRAWR